MASGRTAAGRTWPSSGPSPRSTRTSKLARASPCGPKTLARAARDHVEKQPAFAVEAGCAALEWLAQGIGYEITGADVWMAYSAAMKAAEGLDRAPETKERIRKLAASRYSFVAEILGRELGLSRGSGS